MTSADLVNTELIYDIYGSFSGLKITSNYPTAYLYATFCPLHTNKEDFEHIYQSEINLNILQTTNRFTVRLIVVFNSIQYQESQLVFEIPTNTFIREQTEDGIIYLKHVPTLNTTDKINNTVSKKIDSNIYLKA